MSFNQSYVFNSINTSHAVNPKDMRSIQLYALNTILTCLIQITCYSDHMLNSNIMCAIKIRCVQFKRMCLNRKSLHHTCQVSCPPCDALSTYNMTWPLCTILILEKLVDRVIDTHTTTLSPILEKLVYSVCLISTWPRVSPLLVRILVAPAHVCLVSTPPNVPMCTLQWYPKHMIHQRFLQFENLGQVVMINNPFFYTTYRVIVQYI